MSSELHFRGDRERDPLATVPTECYDVLRHPRRIRVLEILGTHRTRLSLTALTTAVIDREDGDISNGELRHEVRIGLVHNHLPRLAEYDLVEWDAETGAELVDDAPVHPDDLSALLELCDDDDGRELLEALVNPVRMRVISIVSTANGPVSVDRLASELATCEIDALSDPERATVSLYHAHLPVLADVDAVEFDHESGMVARAE